eukprot:scaffold283427_cov34-Prasinocladus_malaysianus.AAC.1
MTGTGDFHSFFDALGAYRSNIVVYLSLAACLASVITPTKTPGRQATRKTSLGDYETPAPTVSSSHAKTPQSSATALLMKASPNTSFQTRSQAMYIEGRILDLIAALESSDQNIDASHPVCSPAQEPVVVAGRIVCDSDGRINNQSVLLEGCMHHSGGQRVRLDLSKLDSYSLFPGQVIAVEGFNPTGNLFIATRILNPPNSSQPEEETPPKVSAHSTVVACGPFTTAENIAFEPFQALVEKRRLLWGMKLDVCDRQTFRDLYIHGTECFHLARKVAEGLLSALLQELLEYCQKEKPGLLVLMGPFVDADHPHIGSGQLDITFDELFAVKVRTHLEAYLQGQGCGTQVVIMPALKDVNHHPVFPQPPMQQAAEARLNGKGPMFYTMHDTIETLARSAAVLSGKYNPV